MTEQQLPCVEFSIVASSPNQVTVKMTLNVDAPPTQAGGEQASYFYASFILSHAWALLRDKGERWAVDKVAVDALQKAVVQHATEFLQKAFGVEVKS